MHPASTRPRLSTMGNPNRRATRAAIGFASGSASVVHQSTLAGTVQISGTGGLECATCRMLERPHLACCGNAR